MAGFQSGETLRQLYAHAGLFVLPSSHEGLPIVLLEALSYGLPTLVSDIPSNLEVVSDPARIFKMGDVDELSSKLETLAAVKMDASAREAVRRENARRYDWSDIAAKTAAAYSDLIGAGASAAKQRPVPAGKPVAPGTI
jgi:glycosyltransferase involved in cell wall biosynthesis